jgi:hypothetical protein
MFNKNAQFERDCKLLLELEDKIDMMLSTIIIMNEQEKHWLKELVMTRCSRILESY